MPRKVDAETLVDRVIELLQQNLPAKITALNAEKADDVVLAQIANDAYAFHSLNDRVMAYDPFCLVGIESIASVGHGPNTSEIVEMTAVVVLADHGQDVEIARRLWRYNRALREVLESNYSDRATGARFEISSLTPVDFKLANSDNVFRAIGVQIRAGIA